MIKIAYNNEIKNIEGVEKVEKNDQNHRSFKYNVFKAGKYVVDKLKEHKKSFILGGVGMAMLGNTEVYGNDIKSKIDTTGPTVNNNFFYGEKVTNNELDFASNSLEEIKKKYKDGTIRAYEVFVTETRFKKLREGKYRQVTEEETIIYNGKPFTVRIFKKGHGKELLQYIREAYGYTADKIIKEWGIDEDSYESLTNLKRDVFFRGVVHGQNKEHTKWVYLAGGPEDKGFPCVILNTKIDGFLEGPVMCSANPGDQAIPVDCEDTKIHNLNVKD